MGTNLLPYFFSVNKFVKIFENLPVSRYDQQAMAFNLLTIQQEVVLRTKTF